MSGTNDEINYITPRGCARLRAEQMDLKHVQRPLIVEEVAYAAALGDRSENAEYIYGKKKLREIDRRLRWLDKRIEAAEIVDPATDRGDVVRFGATVTVGYPDATEQTFELVGVNEIETQLRRISWRSPIGRALMGRQEGDDVTVMLHGERLTLELIDVRYIPQTPDAPTVNPSPSG
jgi:transcription elongation factor GreB